MISHPLNHLVMPTARARIGRRGSSNRSPACGFCWECSAQPLPLRSRTKRPRFGYNELIWVVFLSPSETAETSTWWSWNCLFFQTIQKSVPEAHPFPFSRLGLGRLLSFAACSTGRLMVCMDAEGKAYNTDRFTTRNDSHGSVSSWNMKPTSWAKHN